MMSTVSSNNAKDGEDGSKKTLKIENTEKRDTLIEAEKRYQKSWKDAGVFQQNAPSLEETSSETSSPEDVHTKFPKFFGTMAYPYMNGTLHMGHSFTASKVEFMTGFARMEGKRALFPLGFHCTGMPIKACADKLVNEIERFGRNFERCAEEDTNPKPLEGPSSAPVNDIPREDVSKFTAKKGKVAAKVVRMKYQFQIMLALGIPINDIQLFADPQHWLKHFPPVCKEHLDSIGARIDWRRSFITTDANTYYDSFVRWQMNRLKQLGKIKFGKRYTVYSPKDGQPCLDHDRSVGEGVTVQEYTAIRMKVTEWSSRAKTKCSELQLPKDARFYLVAATLRPETMYGQTCCFVGPKLLYNIVKKSDSEYYVLSERSARNMAFQDILEGSSWGSFETVAQLHGEELIGTVVIAPLSVHSTGIRVLPMETVKATKGTGVVTSVPSDSPDDYATVVELAKKPDYYHIEKSWVDLEIVPIIRTPAYGDLTAPHLVKTMKINSPKDTKLLAEAKEIAYREGFYKGTMIYGEFAGKAVEEAKLLIRRKLISSGEAFAYAEPDGQVISRSADECVAAHLDQWYLNYGKTENGGDGNWQKSVLEYVQGDLNTYSSEARHGFEQTLDWLNQWACARTYGLGSKLPWDPKFLVESLSDSTIYMAYYTIAHYLHADIYGKTPGIANIKPEKMTDDVWDYVFGRTDDIDTDLDMKMLQLMRNEFNYWYPLDVRVSGKDLIQNHLTFFLYIHQALFPRSKWPRSIRANGHLLLNGEKMSKSTGNFLTLSQAVAKFGADATRIALADSGDGIEDANFEETVANSSILKLYELRKWIEEIIARASTSNTSDSEGIRGEDLLRDTTMGLWDHLFENELKSLVKETRQHYSSTMFKSALKSAFYDLTAARDFYRESCKAAGISMHRSLVVQYVEVQALLLSPIAPHWADYIWQEVLKKPTSIQTERYPSYPEPDKSLTAAREYVRLTSTNITSAEGVQQKKMAKGKTLSFDPRKDKKLKIFVATNHPKWQDKYVDLVRESFEGMTLDMKSLSGKIGKMGEAKKAMSFVQSLKKRMDEGEEVAAVLQRKLLFDELEIIAKMVPVLKHTIPKCQGLQVISVNEDGHGGIIVAGDGGKGELHPDLPPIALLAVPGVPSFFFENV